MEKTVQGNWGAVVLLSPQDRTVVAGLDAKIKDGVFSWYEGQHDRARKVAKVISGAPPRDFEFEDDEGRRYQVLPMTLARYREHVRDKTVGKYEFKTLSALIAAMKLEW
jgi:hypothetical protein